jgi:hypothetical protein
MRGLSVVAEAPGRYVDWGVIQISVANLLIIGTMILLFILALVVPFPSGHGNVPSGRGDESDKEGRTP